MGPPTQNKLTNSTAQKHILPKETKRNRFRVKKIPQTEPTQCRLELIRGKQPQVFRVLTCMHTITMLPSRLLQVLFEPSQDMLQALYAQLWMTPARQAMAL